MIGAAETSLLVGSALLLGLLVFFLVGSDRMPIGTSGKPISVYCAAGLQPPVAAAARAYQDQYGIAIDLTYGGSGTLLSQLSVARSGDLYIAADDSYIRSGREKGIVDEDLSLAWQVPVLAVARGNSKGISSLEDLLRDDISVGFAHPEAAAVGRIVRQVLIEAGLWEGVQARVKVFKPTVMDLANDLKIGTIDLAVIWDATAAQYPEIEGVRVQAFDAVRRPISLGVLSWSGQPAAAFHFARYLAARDKGLPHFAKRGYTVADGDRWEETPELLLMSGAMLSKAIDETVAEFEQREGVRVTRIYNGCGILVSQMKSGSRPDAYFACDQSFLDQVSERFESGQTVSANSMVILVAKDNPKKISGLADLARPGLRVGLGHPEKSALGSLTVTLLERGGHLAALKASGNLVVESATGDYLVNQARAGALDAAIVYRSNTAMVGDHLDTVEIGDANAHAVQPYAVARDSTHKQLMGRLLDAIAGQRSQKRFEGLGFDWKCKLPEMSGR